MLSKSWEISVKNCESELVFARYVGSQRGPTGSKSCIPKSQVPFDALGSIPEVFVNECYASAAVDLYSCYSSYVLGNTD